MIVVYIPCKDNGEAESIAELLLDKKLIACANIFPIKSLYFWQGELNKEKEVVLLAKSKIEKWAAIKKEVESVHSYKIPAILKFSADCNKSYENWVNRQLK